MPYRGTETYETKNSILSICYVGIISIFVKHIPKRNCRRDENVMAAKFRRVLRLQDQSTVSCSYQYSKLNDVNQTLTIQTTNVNFTNYSSRASKDKMA